MTDHRSDYTIEYFGYDSYYHTDHHPERTAAEMARERTFLEEHGCWGVTVTDELNPEN